MRESAEQQPGELEKSKNPTTENRRIFVSPRYCTFQAYQPVQYKYVPKPVEIEVKSYQFEAEETGCKNTFGNAVPCAKSKRSPQDDVEAAEADAPADETVETTEAAEEAVEAEAVPAEALPVETRTLEMPYYYTNTYNTLNTLTYPLAYNTYPYAVS